MIRPMNAADARWAAEQHAGLMKNSVFAFFGVGFLECFYDCFAQSEHGIAFVYEDEGRPRAVIASTSNRPAFLRELGKRYGLRLVPLVLRGLFRRACLQLLFQVPSYLRNTGAERTDAEMVFITVDPEFRRSGIARSLIEATLAEYRQRNVRKVNVSIESDNQTVKRILESMGFAVKRTFSFAGKRNDFLEREL